MGIERNWKGWCGVVWYGVVWHCVVWCGVVWYGMLWYGMVCQGVPSAKAFQGPRRVCQDRPQGGTCTATLDWKGWCGMVWYGVVWHGMVWCGVVWYGMVWCGMVCQGVPSAVPSAKAFQWPRRSNGQGVWARHDEWYDGAGAECVSRTRRVRPCVRCGGMGARGFRRPGCWWQYRRAPLQLRAGAYHSSWRPRQDDWYFAGAVVGSAVRVQRALLLPYGGWWERGLGQGLSAFLGMFN